MGWMLVIPCLEVRTSLYTVSVPLSTGAAAQHTITEASEQRRFHEDTENKSLEGPHLCQD